MPAFPRPARIRWVPALLGLTLILNLLDLVATLLFVQLGYAEEANPLMAGLLELGAPWFALGKLALVSLGVYVLWRFRHRWLARFGSVAVFVAYGALAVHHARWAETLARLG